MRRLDGKHVLATQRAWLIADAKLLRTERAEGVSSCTEDRRPIDVGTDNALKVSVVFNHQLTVVVFPSGHGSSSQHGWREYAGNRVVM